MAGRLGLWVFYNQGHDLDWPTPRDGPFRAAWENTDAESEIIYGRLLTAGAASGGRGSEVPFAIVATAAPPIWAAITQPLGYRYGTGRRHSGRLPLGHRCRYQKTKHSYTPCPRAAYCWAAGDLDDTQLPSGRSLEPLDVMAAGGKFIVQALLNLAQYIEDQYNVHQLHGTFERRARQEGRKAQELRIPWARQGEVTRHLREVLARA